MPDQEKQVAIYPPKDIGDFWIKAEYNEHWCDFACVECIAFGDSKDGNYDTPWYRRKELMGWIDDPTKAKVFLSGSIKWDGCADLYFDAQDDCCLHFCGRRSAKRIGELFDRLYDIASQLIAHFDHQLAR